jgi:hypothetical protein
MKTLEHLGYVKVEREHKPTILFDRPGMFRSWLKALKALGWLGLLGIIIGASLFWLYGFVRAW